MRDGIDASSAAFRISRFSKPYRQRLLAGFRDLHDYTWSYLKKPLGSVISNAACADEVLSQYVMHRHANMDGKRLYVVKHALLCCQHVQPKIRGKIATAWDTLRVWEEQRSNALRPPLPVPLWLLMIGLSRAQAAVNAAPLEREKWTIFATLLEVGLLCMFRPGELLKLKHSDFSMPGNFTFSQPFAAIRVASPKNRRQFGLEQFVLLRNPCTVERLREILKEGLDKPLWKSTSNQFSQMFRKVCKDLKISDCHLTPGSLRPGGATMYYSRGIPISTLRFMGRWSVERSLEHYIQLAMSTLIMNKLSTAAVALLKKVAGPCLEFVVPDEFHALLPNLKRRDHKSSAAIASWCSKYASLEGETW